MSTSLVKEDLTKYPYKRIAKELKEILGKYIIVFEDESIMRWKLYLDGVDGTPYEDGVFELSIVFPTDYPFRPPKVRFNTKFFSSNVNDQGGMCLLILKDNWSPGLTIDKIIRTIQTLMTDPSPDEDPLIKHIASMYKTDRVKFNETAREWTKLYALPKIV